MPRYFFDVRDGIVVEDTVGVELPDLDAAHAHALGLSRKYAASPGMIAEEGGALIVSIRDMSGTVLARHRLVFSVENLEATS